MRLRRAVLLGATFLAGSAVSAVAGPILQLSGSTNFGNVLVGQTATTAVTAKNIGSGTPNMTAVFGGASGEFSPTSTQTFSNVAPGQSRTATYVYKPVNVGADSQNVSVTGNVSGAFTLTGNGVAPVQQTAVTGAGNVLVGTTGSASIKVTNTGNGNLSGQGAVSNLAGTVGSASGVFTGSGGVVNLGDGASQTYGYQFAPTARGLETRNVGVAYTNGNAAGTNQAQNVTAALTGTGVAPVGSVGPVDPDTTRVGTTMNGAVVVKNLGDGNLSGQGSASNLKGTVGGSAGVFAGSGGAVDLGDGAESAFSYSYTPTARGSNSADIAYAFQNGAADGSNAGFSGMTTINGLAVSPIFDTDIPVAGLDFGAVAGGGSRTLSFTLGNITPDIGPDYLVGLTLLDIVIGGADKDLFTLLGFIPGTVLSPGGMLSLSLRFDAPFADLASLDASIEFLTDQGTSFGGDGMIFSYDLNGSVFLRSPVDVPEAPALSILLLGIAALALRHRPTATG